jgi:hypothetical protein
MLYPVLGSDHLDTFSMTCVPTFSIICGNRVIADHVGHHYDLPNHRELAEDLLESSFSKASTSRTPQVSLRPSTESDTDTESDDEPGSVAKDYSLDAEQRKVAQNLVDVGSYQGKVSDVVPYFVEIGVHPLMALMAVHAAYPAAKKAAQEKVGAIQKN